MLDQLAGKLYAVAAMRCRGNLARRGRRGRSRWRGTLAGSGQRRYHEAHPSSYQWQQQVAAPPPSRLNFCGQNFNLSILLAGFNKGFKLLCVALQLTPLEPSMQGRTADTQRS